VPEHVLHCELSNTQLTIIGELTKYTSSRLWQLRQAIVNKQINVSISNFCFNFKQLTTIDSAGLATIIALLGYIQKHPTTKNQVIIFTHIPPQMKILAEANQLHPIFSRV